MLDERDCGYILLNIFNFSQLPEYKNVTSGSSTCQDINVHSFYPLWSWLLTISGHVHPAVSDESYLDTGTQFKIRGNLFKYTQISVP